jgi:exopolysaccharide production protein ExoQ
MRSAAATGQHGQAGRRHGGGRMASAPVAGPAAGGSSLGDLIVGASPYFIVTAVAYPALYWAMVEAIPETGVLMAPGASAAAPPSMVLRGVFPVLFLLSATAFVLACRRKAVAWAHPVLLLCGLFLGLALWSHTWAIDPDMSLRRSLLTIFIAVVFVGSAVATPDIRRLMDGLFWLMVAVALFNLVAILTRPPTSIGHAGIYPHKNVFGGVAAVLIQSSLYQAAAGSKLTRAVAYPMILTGALFLILSQSKTSLALAAISPAMGLAFAWAARAGRLSPAVSVAAAFGSVFFVYWFGSVSGLWDFHAMAQAIFGDPTLTERTQIWAFAFRMMPEHPWLGFGYEGFWDAGPESPAVRAGGAGFVAAMPHAHNGYIDLVLQTGAVGLAIFAAMFLAALHAAGHAARVSFARGVFVLSVLIFTLFYNLFETSFFRSFGITQMVMLLAIGLVIASWSEPTEEERRR